MAKVTEVNVVTGKQTTRDMTESEEKAISDAVPSESAQLSILRHERNILLKETDYMGLSDIAMSAKWKTYRQELRDITKTFKSMEDKDFKFPTKPE